MLGRPVLDPHRQYARNQNNACTAYAMLDMFRPDRGILDKKSNIPIQKRLCMHTQVLEAHLNLIESDVIPKSSLDLLECYCESTVS